MMVEHVRYYGLSGHENVEWNFLIVSKLLVEYICPQTYTKYIITSFLIYTLHQVVYHEV